MPTQASGHTLEESTQKDGDDGVWGSEPIWRVGGTGEEPQRP